MKTFTFATICVLLLVGFFGVGYLSGREKGYDNGYIDGLRYATRLALEIAAPKQTTNYIIVPLNTNTHYLPQ